MLEQGGRGGPPPHAAHVVQPLVPAPAVLQQDIEVGGVVTRRTRHGQRVGEVARGAADLNHRRDIKGGRAGAVPRAGDEGVQLGAVPQLGVAVEQEGGVVGAAQALGEREKGGNREEDWECADWETLDPWHGWGLLGGDPGRTGTQ